MPTKASALPLRATAASSCAARSLSVIAGSVPAEDQAAAPARDDRHGHGEHTVDETVFARETEDLLLEAGFDDLQLRRGLLDERAALEQEGARPVGADRDVGRQRQRRPEQVLRQE